LPRSDSTEFVEVKLRDCTRCGSSALEEPFILSGKVAEDFGAVTLTVKRVERIPKTGA